VPGAADRLQVVRNLGLHSKCCTLSLPCTADLLIFQLQDKHSWITDRPPHTGESKKPLPFDLHYKPKPAFDGMIEAMA